LVAEAQAGDPRSTYVPLTKEDRLLWKERTALRKIMHKPNTSDKLGGIITALEQELFDVWGVTEPIDVKICPHPGSLTLEGLAKSDVNNSECLFVDTKEAA
jgi:hypothetical protein